MQKSTKFIVLPITFVILFAFAFTFYFSWRKMTIEGYHSCIASIANEVWKLDATKDLAANNKNWKILSEVEANSILSQVHGYDCSVADTTLDIWNNRINIALRKPSDKVEIMVWSNGADEISGTDDDLVIPWGEKVPK